MELALYADTITQDYDLWRKRRVNSQQISPTSYTFQNHFSEEMPSELEAKLLRDISSLQEENYQLKIDVQIEKSQTVKIQREAEIVRNDLRNIHLENKKLRSTVKNSGLGKSSVEWKKELSNIKEEKKAARVTIELRKKNIEYETMSAELMTSQSKHQELRGKIRDFKNTLQAHQQQLDNLLKALKEKNSQYDRDTRTYERALQEKEMQLDFLINEIHKAAICQFLPSQRSSMSEFLERVKKQGNVARKFV
ncbi:hypothetical protein V6Z12_A07G071800 [Gossypium hirsutum]